MTRLTDRVAIRRALEIAIDTEESLIDAYDGDLTQDGPKLAKQHVDAFTRVLNRYYGGRRKDPLAGRKRINIFDVMLGKIDIDGKEIEKK